MANKKTYEGVLAEVWEQGKVAKIVVKATEEEIRELMQKLNKKVKLTFDE
jgi:hypothetical protein